MPPDAKLTIAFENGFGEGYNNKPCRNYSAFEDEVEQYRKGWHAGRTHNDEVARLAEVLSLTRPALFRKAIQNLYRETFIEYHEST